MKKKEKTALQVFADWLAELTPKQKERLQASHSKTAFVVFVDKGVKFGMVEKDKTKKL